MSARWLWWPVLALAGGGHALALAWPWSGLILDRGEPVAWLQVLSLAVLESGLWRADSMRDAALRAWCFATAWLAGTFWWLFISMHTYGGLPAVLAVLAVFALAALLALYYMLAGALCWRWRQTAWLSRVLSFAAFWTLAELARGTLFTGFPWGAGGYALVDALGWLAPYGGVYGLGAVGAALSAGLAASIGFFSFSRKSGLVLGVVWLPVAVVLAWPGAGRHLLLALPGHTESAGVLPVVLLQGHIPQDEKFQSGSGVPLALNWYRSQIRSSIEQAAGSASLVVAPETAIPLLPAELPPGYWTGLEAAVEAGRSAVLMGVPMGSWKDGYTNSAVGLMPAGQTYRYDKRHLVPFGEFIPPFFRWFIDLMRIPLGDFRRGAAGQPPMPWAGQRIAPNICYEDLFGEELAAGFLLPEQSPTLLVNLSNIAWFGNTVAIDQHRQISRLRSLELERPMLRATNTGATVVIDHTGRPTHALAPHLRGVLHAEAQGRTGLTPFARWASRWGLWPVLAVCLALLVLAWRVRGTGRRQDP